MNRAFMVAATGSGCGKTTITCALLKSLINKGLVPHSYKCGPDYIDPMFHRKVLGIEAENLDLFFSNQDEVRSIFYRDRISDVKIVEGVMGLFDGVNVISNEASSYDLACKLDIPVILIVNAQGMGRSLLAIIKGFLDMDEKRMIRGVILNKISSRQYDTMKPLIEDELGIAVIGFCPKLEKCVLESRYLGLKMPGEIVEIEENLDYVASIVTDTVDIDKLLDISFVDKDRCEIVCDNIEQNKLNKENNNLENRIRIGIARDEAFCFYYEENMRMLKSLGVELVEFSPLKDKELPEELDGLILGGGYPELYAEELSNNKSMINSIKSAIESGVPSLAECGGFMYLHDNIIVDGTHYPMVGCIEGTCEKKDRLVRFGYMTIQEIEGQFIDGEQVIKGHEFHYYDSTNNGSNAISTKPYGNRSWKAAHISYNHWWGFAHLYYPSNVDFISSYIKKCRTYSGDGSSVTRSVPL